jgi:uncharacterized membrane protein
VHQFELRPNRSLTLRLAAVFYVSIVATSIVIAGGFAAAGYWPVLLFAGLELVALGAAQYWNLRQGQRREFIQIDDESVCVSKSGCETDTEIRFSRPWTRVELIQASNKLWSRGLMLKCMSRCIEIGSFLTDEERRGLRNRLSTAIKSS